MFDDPKALTSVEWNNIHMFLQWFWIYLPICYFCDHHVDGPRTDSFDGEHWSPSSVNGALADATNRVRCVGVRARSRHLGAGHQRNIGCTPGLAQILDINRYQQRPTSKGKKQIERKN
jgi:hypothetical protein